MDYVLVLSSFVFSAFCCMHGGLRMSIRLLFRYWSYLLFKPHFLSTELHLPSTSGRGYFCSVLCLLSSETSSFWILRFSKPNCNCSTVDVVWEPWLISTENIWGTLRSNTTLADFWSFESNRIMDVLALEAKSQNGAEAEKKPTPKPKPKPQKKTKRIVYFEVEIVDLKTKEKLLLLDKVSEISGFFLISLNQMFWRQIRVFEQTCHFANKSLIIHWLPVSVVIGYVSIERAFHLRGENSPIIPEEWSVPTTAHTLAASHR